MKVKNLNNHVEHIISGYKQQYLLYQQLVQISRQFSQQLTLQVGTPVADGDGLREELIQQIMQKRTELVENIKELDSNISLHKEAIINLLHLKEFNLGNVQELIHANLRQELHEQVVNLGQVIRSVMETDNKSRETIKVLQQNISKKLKNINRHFELQQAYLDRPEMFPEPRFLDKKK